MPTKIGGGRLENSPHALNNWINGKVQGPLAVEVSPTGGCNHKCVHCSYQQFEEYSTIKHMINFDVFKRFIHSFAMLGGQEVFYAGVGEPTMNIELEDMAKYAFDLGVSNSMSTNGIPWNKRRIENTVPYFDWIRFTVNGGNKEIYSKIHQCRPSDFDKLKRNLSYASNYIRENRLKCKLIIQFIASDDSISSLNDLIDLYNETGVNSVVIRNLMDKDGLNSKTSTRLLEVLRSIEHEHSDYIKIRWDTFNNSLKGADFTKCYGINFRCNLDDNGNISTCSRRLVYPSTIGNILDNSFEEIWNSNKKKELFLDIETGKYIKDCHIFCDVSEDNVFSEKYVKNNQNSKSFIELENTY